MKTKLYRMTETDWVMLQQAARDHARTFSVGEEPHLDKIYAAILRAEEARPRVKIEVLGGVAEVTRCSPGVTVTIKDHDNDE